MAEKILVAMSGGVDSSVCAHLLREAGYDCIGATMHLHDATNTDEAEDARRIAESLGMPFEILDFSEEFGRHVIDYFIQTYREGGTPNPCVECNRTMKFGCLLNAATALGCAKLATGHYARVEQVGDRYLLKKAVDPTKDQSYVLWSLSQEQLSRVVFPLGDLTKEEARRIALENGFCNAARRDSQDICFIPDGDYVAFIERTTGETFPAGKFLDVTGKVLGEHQGLLRYTIGQRKGLGIAFGKPTYVCKKNAKDNTITLGSNEELFTHELTAHAVNLIACDRIDAPMRVEAKARYTAKASWATVEQTGEDEIRVVFDEAQRAISAGQSVVLYDGDTVIGGGTITEVL